MEHLIGGDVIRISAVFALIFNESHYEREQKKMLSLRLNIFTLLLNHTHNWHGFLQAVLSATRNGKRSTCDVSRFSCWMVFLAKFTFVKHFFSHQKLKRKGNSNARSWANAATVCVCWASVYGTSTSLYIASC